MVACCCYGPTNSPCCCAKVDAAQKWKVDLKPLRSKQRSSGYHGVKSPHYDKNKFQADLPAIKEGGKSKYLGVYDTAEEAARVLAVKYLEVHGSPPKHDTNWSANATGDAAAKPLPKESDVPEGISLSALRIMIQDHGLQDHVKGNSSKQLRIDLLEFLASKAEHSQYRDSI